MTSRRKEKQDELLRDRSSTEERTRNQSDEHNIRRAQYKTTTTLGKHNIGLASFMSKFEK